TSVAILPGRPVRMVFSAVDTAIYAGGSLTLKASAADNRDNLYPDQPVWVAPNNSVVTVSPEGAVTAVSIGRAVIGASAAGFRDSVVVSVIPKGLLSAELAPIPHKLFLYNTDGTNLKTIPAGAGETCGLADIA